MKYVFIVNPISGGGKGLSAGKAIEEYCGELRLDYKIYYTLKSGDATRFASLHRDKNTIIYSVGGDGTLNEIVNGIAKSYAMLSVVPVGSGNDFYKSLQGEDYSAIDLCKVNEKYFVNIASLGIDAEVANTANELKSKNFPSSMVYILGIIKTLFSFKKIDVHSGDETEPLTLLAICNGKYYGGGFKIMPDAKLDDGKFGICKVPRLSKIYLLNVLRKLINGTHTSDNHVMISSSDEIQMLSQIPLICNVDGEIIKDTHFSFSLQKQGLKIRQNEELGINKMLYLKKILKLGTSD